MVVPTVVTHVCSLVTRPQVAMDLSVACPNAQEPNANRTACIDCASVSDGHYRRSDIWWTVSVATLVQSRRLTVRPVRCATLYLLDLMEPARYAAMAPSQTQRGQRA